MHRTTSRPAIFLKIMLLLYLVDICAAWLVTRKFPNYRYLIIDENQLVENLTAIFFFTTFLLAIIFALKLRRISKQRGLWAISIISLVGFLDEISFGEMLFDLSMPTLAGVKIDAVHDVVELAYMNIQTVPKSLIALVCYLFLLALWLTTRQLNRKWEAPAHKFVRFCTNPSTFFILFFVFFISAAILIDLHLFRSRLLFSLEEVFEMNAAFALFFFSLYLYAFETHKERSETDAPVRTEHDASAVPGPQIETPGSGVLRGGNIAEDRTRLSDV